MIYVRVETRTSLDVMAAGRRIMADELGTLILNGRPYRQVVSRTLTRRFPHVQVWIDEDGRLATRTMRPTRDDDPSSETVSFVWDTDDRLRRVGPSLPGNVEMLALAWIEPPPRGGGDTRMTRLYFAHSLLENGDSNSNSSSSDNDNPTADDVCFLPFSSSCSLRYASEEQATLFKQYKNARVRYSVEGESGESGESDLGTCKMSEEANADSVDGDTDEDGGDDGFEDGVEDGGRGCGGDGTAGTAGTTGNGTGGDGAGVESRARYRLRKAPVGTFHGRRVHVVKRNVFVTDDGLVRYKKEWHRGLHDVYGATRLPLPWGSCSLADALSAAYAESRGNPIDDDDCSPADAKTDSGRRVHDRAARAAREALELGHAERESLQHVYDSCGFDCSERTFYEKMQEVLATTPTASLSPHLTHLLSSAATRRAAAKLKCNRHTPLRELAEELSAQEVQTEGCALYSHLRVARIVVAKANEQAQKLPSWF